MPRQQREVVGRHEARAGEEDATGKSSTSDLREGRRTYLIRGVQRVCTPVEWVEIDNHDDLARAREIVCPS